MTDPADPVAVADIPARTGPAASGPAVVAPQYIERFYRGGGHLTDFRSTPAGDFDPEDWVGSTTEVAGGTPGQGLSVLPDGRRLADAVRDDPVGWLGPDHVARHGADTGLLVKLLDAGERLPVHVHPDREFARRHLDCPHGKTEAWVVLAAPTDGAVHLGFTEEVDPAELAGWVEAQDSERMLAVMHRLPVAAGDTVLVPAGLPHAIGAGVFVIELQEPTDFSILLEWTGFRVDGAAGAHLGLGLPLALQAVDRGAWTPDRIARLRHRAAAGDGVHRLLVPAADPFFRAELVRGAGRVEASFAVLVVTAGSVTVTDAAGGRTTLDRGRTVVVPHAAGPLTLESTGPVAGAVVRCLPPPADAPAGSGAPARPEV